VLCCAVDWGGKLPSLLRSRLVCKVDSFAVQSEHMLCSLQSIPEKITEDYIGQNLALANWINLDSAISSYLLSTPPSPLSLRPPAPSPSRLRDAPLQHQAADYCILPQYTRHGTAFTQLKIPEMRGHELYYW
jgi:hypothetical protein